MWTGRSASRPPSHRAGNGSASVTSAASDPTRALTQTWSSAAVSQRVNTLTLYARPSTPARSAATAARGTCSYTTWRTAYDGTSSSVTDTTTPTQPSDTTAPSKPGSPRRSSTRSPSPVTSSRPETADASPWLPEPEPWVPVATAPATDRCGSEARFGSARPAASNASTTSPYRSPAATRACRCAVSISTAGGRPAIESCRPSVSASGLNEWPVPSTRTRRCDVTSSRTCSDRGGPEHLGRPEGDVAGPVRHRCAVTVPAA